ncbi:MAG: hypothetical protein L0211_10385 [Planctomycetaceae bacterium]|nr:hypothetical protein [Planctomycetaceae bacterium]
MQINGRDGADTINIQGTPADLGLEITGGLGADVVNVGVFVFDPSSSLAAGTPQNLNAIDGDALRGLPLALRGDDPDLDDDAARDALHLFDTTDTADNFGVLREDSGRMRLSGLGMRVDAEFRRFEDVAITLGSGSDQFLVRTTHTASDGTGTAVIHTGAGDDAVDVFALRSSTIIEGGDGNDVMRVNPDLDEVNRRPLPSQLALRGDSGSDQFFINLASSGNSRTRVEGGTGPGEDTLTIRGTNRDDVFLLRKDFVALMNVTTAGDLEVQRVDYSSQINGRLTINGLEGDDHFALDDVTAQATINGNGGNDSFQVGQMFKAPRDTAAGVGLPDPLDLFDSRDLADVPFETVHTTRGFLSNGVSRDTVINGGTGEDDFVVFHNRASLCLNGGDGNLRNRHIRGAFDRAERRLEICFPGEADRSGISVLALGSTPKQIQIDVKSNDSAFGCKQVAARFTRCARS